MRKYTCTGNHKAHICQLASKECIEEIMTMTKEPKYICFNCGRVADQAKNLCNPMPLE